MTQNKPIVVLNEIGAGAYGTVYRAKQGNQVVAVKLFNFDKYGLNESAITEVLLLSTLHHDNIVSFVKTGICDGKFCIVMEHMQTDLRHLIRKNSLNHAQIIGVIGQILNGVDYLHRRNVSHRDLKPENILFTSPNVVKIGDFGMAKLHNAIETRHSTPVQTIYYRAPEVVLARPLGQYSLQIDIWSVAAIFAEMFTRTPLFLSTTEKKLLHAHYKVLGVPTKLDRLFPDIEFEHLRNKYSTANNLKAYVNAGSDVIIDMLNNMFDFDYTERPTAQECLQRINNLT
ncbi:cyclin-dependent kinase 2 homolog [Amphiura filiformis]|uniref:cyclin-dependent kinase 2 homolog n=1 Tax=Amphiura filiformis TaxID=82378 RepID=UPI003B211FE9